MGNDGSWVGGVWERDGQEQIPVTALGDKGCAYGSRGGLQGLCLLAAAEVPAAN